MEQGEVAVKLARAVESNAAFEAAGVPDTPANRAMYDSIKDDVSAMPEGVVPDMPWDP